MQAVGAQAVGGFPGYPQRPSRIATISRGDTEASYLSCAGSYDAVSGLLLLVMLAPFG